MTETKTIIEALRSLAKDYKGFGIEEEIVRLAADRLEKQQRRIRNQRREIEALALDKHRVDLFVKWLNQEMFKCDFLRSEARTERFNALAQSRKHLKKLRNGIGEQQ